MSNMKIAESMAVVRILSVRFYVTRLLSKAFFGGVQSVQCIHSISGGLFLHSNSVLFLRVTTRSMVNSITPHHCLSAGERIV